MGYLPPMRMGQPMNAPRLTITLTADAVLVDAWGENDLMTWQGAYRWGAYGVDGMVERVLRDLPDWITENAPAWVGQWETEAGQR